MFVYSIVIMPSDEVVSSISVLKQKLYKEIGWYNSCNSLAHITICLFTANDDITVWEEYINKVISTLTPCKLIFNRIELFSNGALVALPDIHTSNTLRPFTKEFCKIAPTTIYGKSYKPHLSIARNLNKENSKKALELINAVDLNFLWDNISIRKLNVSRGQYDIYQTFGFK